MEKKSRYISKTFWYDYEVMYLNKTKRNIFFHKKVKIANILDSFTWSYIACIIKAKMCSEGILVILSHFKIS